LDNGEHEVSWPKGITEWHVGDTGYLSVPFTWLLSKAKARILQGDIWTERWVAGGPAVNLMPDYLRGIDAVIGGDLPGVLQRVNPQATRTTVGCPHRCKFCGVGQRLIEGKFRELDDWPDLPIICDNNLLAASLPHFGRVIDRLVQWGWCDFEQGIDWRYLTQYHADRISEVKKPMVRLALDRWRDREHWGRAVERLLDAGIAKSHVRAYVLCGFEGIPEDDWRRCEFVEAFGVKALPMWFHRLDCLQYGEVTFGQQSRGWTKAKQRQLMRWYYKHSGERLVPQPTENAK